MNNFRYEKSPRKYLTYSAALNNFEKTGLSQQEIKNLSEKVLSVTLYQTLGSNVPVATIS